MAGWFLCVVVTSLSTHTPTVVRSLPTCSPEGLMATHPTEVAMGEEEPMGTMAFSPGNVSSSSWSKHCCYKLSLGCSRAPSPPSTPLGRVRTVLTHEDFPHQQ